MSTRNDVFLDPQKVPEYAWAFVGSAAYDLVYKLKTDPATRAMFEARKAVVKQRRSVKEPKHGIL